MGKLYFRHGTVGSAKTMNLLAVAYKYQQQERKIFLIKPALDDRFGADVVKSRVPGLERKADLLVKPDTQLDRDMFTGVCCVLVDEVQFMSPAMIDQLRSLVDELGIPVLCYGLRTDFRLQLFAGAERLLEVADCIEEIKSTCHFCLRKACSNLKLIDGKPTLSGPQVQLGAEETYVPSCYEHFSEKTRQPLLFGSVAEEPAFQLPKSRGKLYFRHGSVGSAKTMNLLAVAHKYDTQQKTVCVIKPAVDTRFGSEMVKSRLPGLQRRADVIVAPNGVLPRGAFLGVDCVLVDEAQFLTSAVIDQLRAVVDELRIPVICYGLRTDFRTSLFDGSKRLFELADNIEEVKATCQFCSKKATINLKLIDGKPTLFGPQVQLGTEETYVPSCSRHFAEKTQRPPHFVDSPAASAASGTPTSSLPLTPPQFPLASPASPSRAIGLSPHVSSTFTSAEIEDLPSFPSLAFHGANDSESDSDSGSPPLPSRRLPLKSVASAANEMEGRRPSSKAALLF